jgi:hypothetical protein
VLFVGIFEVFWSIARYFLCLVAVFELIRRKKMGLLFLLLIFIGYFSFITGHDGCARFRMMFEFLLIALAAGGANVIFKTLRKKLFLCVP